MAILTTSLVETDEVPEKFPRSLVSDTGKDHYYESPGSGPKSTYK